MKSIKVLFITFILLLVSNIEAQTGPTKQQTVTELNNLEIGRGIQFLQFRSIYDITSIYKNFSEYNFSIDERNDCFLIVDWTESYTNTRKTDNNYEDKPMREIIDMSKVKTIFFTFSEDAADSLYNGKDLINTNEYRDYWYNLYINFTIVDADGNNIKTITLLYSLIRSLYEDGPINNINQENYKKTQVYKVFNHYRKLCGAPEPLSWD